VIIYKRSNFSSDRISEFNIDQGEEKKLPRKILWLQIVIAASIVVASMVCSFSVLASDIKIGIVNTVKILRESAPAISAQKKIEQEFLPRDEQIKKMAASVEALQKKLEKESDTLGETGRREMERELATISLEYQRAQQQMQEDFSLRQNDERGLIVEYINKAINKIAEAENYDLIFHLQDTVFRSERIDITDQVMKALEDK
jgi:outer membrane protein